MNMRRTLSIIVFGLAFFLAPQIGLVVTYAWWVVIVYEPDGTSIHSIPISEIDPSWSFADPLSKKDAVPPEELDDFEKNYESDGFSFSKEGDFNADGKRDRAIVGVYKDRAGKTGRFLLILTETQRNKWVKSFLYKNPGKSGFSILHMEAGHLVWYFCMGCDIRSSVTWEKGRYKVR